MWLKFTDPKSNALASSPEPWWEWDGFIGVGYTPPWTDTYIWDMTRVMTKASVCVAKAYTKAYWACNNDTERKKVTALHRPGYVAIKK